MDCKDCKYYSNHNSINITDILGYGYCSKLTEAQNNSLSLPVIIYTDNYDTVLVKEDFGCKMFEKK